MATITGFEKDNEGVFIRKDTEATLTYTIDWEDWLVNSDTISSSNFTVESIAGDQDALVKQAQSSTNYATTIRVTGGTAGKIYKIYNQITTSGGLTDRRFFRVKVETRSL